MVEVPSGEAKVRLRRLVGWGLLGQISYVVCQFLILVALARFASVEDVGRFGLASAIILPIYWFFNLGVRANQATDARSEFSFREFRMLRIVASAVAYGIIVAIALVFVGPEMRPVMLVFGAAKGIETFSDLCYGMFQKGERMNYVARSLILRGFAGAALFWGVIVLTGSTTAAYGGLLVAWALITLGLDLGSAGRLARATGDNGLLRAQKVRLLAVTSLPLAFNALLSALQASTPRYMIGHLLGLAALGQFTVVAYAMQAVTTVTMAIGQSIVARLAHYSVVGNKRAFGRTLRQLVALIAGSTVAGTVLALVIGEWVLVTVFGPAYTGLAIQLALCLVAAGVSASATILQSGLLATRNFGINLQIRIVTFCAIVALTAAGAYYAGLSGVITGMIIASLLQGVLLGRALVALPFETDADGLK
ncbi:MAG: oligosaccharide flippase family protein [Pseudomonadota bacterium]|nr:oligosaccharide flippase family protein [Pseudomonadota bacterium]